MKKIFTLFLALMAVVSIYADTYFLKSTWGEAEASWKQMIDDDGSFIFEGNVFFDGKDIAINTVASDEGARIIKVENIDATLNFEPAPLAAGDSVFFIYVPDMYNQYNEKESGLMAMINFKKGVAIQIKGAWKEMLADDGAFVLLNEYFDGKNVTLATGKDIRSIQPANITSLLNYEPASIAAGDSALFAYDPELYSAYDPAKSGLTAIINYKAGYAIKIGEAWKNLVDDDPEDHDWWILENVLFDGKNVQLAHGSGINQIKPKNIKAYISYEDAELSAGDSVMFIFRPSLVNSHDEKESGLNAHITKKAGYALKNSWGEKTVSWKAMVKQDEDTYIIENVLFDGADIIILNGTDFRTIKPENIKAYLLPNYDEAELEAGDIVVFMYTPSDYAAMDPSKPGLSALIIEKHGYALKSSWGEKTASWKAMVKQDEDTYTIENVLFDGADIKINNFASDEGARTIKPENIAAYLLPSYEEAELEAGDIVVFMYTPSEYASMDPSKPGLSALILEKHGYALKSGWGEDADSWKAMVKQDEDTYTIENVLFDGGDVKINNFATEAGARTIKPENIKAYMLPSYEEAVLEAGDIVVFMYTPSDYAAMDPSKPGLNALIIKKHGYALKVGGEWNELTVDAEDADWWTLEKAQFDGNDVKINNFAGNKGARTIKPENIKAYINYDDAELSAGDSVMFIFRPSLVNQYDEKESGLNAMITNKAGYALKSTWGEENASWKAMAKQDEDTYILENVLFDGDDIVILNGAAPRTIKPENIAAYLLPSYEEAVLEAGDLVVFMYTPSEYASMDPSKPGLSALILEKHTETGIGNLETETKAVKVIMNGQFYIIKNGKTYNASGAVVR